MSLVDAVLSFRKTYRNRVLLRMPAPMQLNATSALTARAHDATHNLLPEINPFRLHLILLASLPSLTLCLSTATATNLLGLERRLVSLENGIVLSVDVVDPEVVVIRSRQNLPIASSALPTRRKQARLTTRRR